MASIILNGDSPLCGWAKAGADCSQLRSFHEYGLTDREREVAGLWSLQKSALYISNELNISEGTVRNMIKSIYSKMSVSDRWQFAKKLAQ
ncbi:helix-turn-helix transcriptional regulator [Paenibacillus donghaensis]|uniref:helix-turn-helix transcriptional regulator n=1 Tax=Paenibacillus donghaensis TaxID=414771 RepID=UPI0012FE6689|nr:helix-turn-helix transcriptional regulator [Paenibacillus donghaensis]